MLRAATNAALDDGDKVMRLVGKNTEDSGDPRETESAEIIDLASRAGFPAVADRKAKTDGLGLAAGVLIVCGLGAVTWWSMNAARVSTDQGVGNPNAVQPATAQATVAPVPVTPKKVEPPKPGAPASPS